MLTLESPLILEASLPGAPTLCSCRLFVIRGSTELSGADDCATKIDRWYPHLWLIYQDQSFQWNMGTRRFVPQIRAVTAPTFVISAEASSHLSPQRAAEIAERSRRPSW
jgi:hypothetical protein